ncbi:MAG: hypothetical protein COA78_02830 [Blastopirellula sp.]|nr:MAG: hypothetical protein COA78_02830 [Blastopirellula sp.]
MSSSFESKESLLAEFQILWDDAEAIWNANLMESDFQGYVSSDFPGVFEELYKLRGRVHTVLEWGSGLGVIAMMAARMGFSAYGIESEARIVQLAEELAEKHDSTATFMHGTFIPEEFEWEPEIGDEFQGTEMEGESAYDKLDMELRDFDLVFAYPWPDEHSLFHTIMREHGARNALLLTYDGREGISLTRMD